MGKKNTRLIALLTACTACSAGTEDLNEPEFPSGQSRLTARFTQPVDGGPEKLLHLFDREIDQKCFLLPINGRPNNGAIPDAGEAVHCTPYTMGQIVYLDANCSEQYVFLWGNASEVIGALSAPGEIEYVRLGAKIPLPEKLYSTGGSSGCHENDALTIAGTSLKIHSIEETYRLEQFSSGTMQIRALAEHLTAGFFGNDKGFSVMMYLRDTKANTSCHAGETAVGGRCIPDQSGAERDDGYRDENCERIIVKSYVEPIVAQIHDRPGGTDEVFRMSVVEEGTPISKRSDSGECVPIVNYWATHNRRTRLFYAEEYPPTEWPSLTINTEMGERLRLFKPAYPNTPDGLVDMLSSRTKYYDTELEQSCSPVHIDGGNWCAPMRDGNIDASVYSDALCTIQLIGVAKDTVQPGLVTLYGDETQSVRTVLPKARIYAPTDKVAQGSLYRKTNEGRCESYRFAAFQYYSRTEVGPEKLAALKVITR
jgi:hypothetical protein